ncbi:multidrug transporter [Campylobacter sp. 19-13652]|nr:SMR family transporter [Campylobacter sp. 19-13652]BCX79889.1 multidrug transporter [Campylobacter sp. 19-13652]
MINAWVLLGISVVMEVVATTLLKLSEGFSRPLYAICSMLIYLVLFYLLSIVFKSIPVGIAYAIWSGLGIVLISLIGYFFLAQKLDMPALIGIALIIAGVVVINLFSKTASH